MMKKVFIKLLAIIFIFAMSTPIIESLGANANEVQAEETQTVGYVMVPSSSVTITNPSDNTQLKIMSVKTDDETYEQYADYIFAGWYTDKAATNAAASGTTEKIQSGTQTVYYAKFVPADVLSTKVQVTNGIVTETTNDDYRGKYVMRFVSSVDSKDYKYAGFELSYTDKETQEKVTLTSKTTKVFKRIDSTTGVTNATDNNVDTYEFSPKVVDTKSTYFITSKLPVAEEDIDVDYTVRAYWMTKDGTKVYGSERCVSVEDGAGETAKTRINLTVDKELSTADGVTYTANITNCLNIGLIQQTANHTAHYGTIVGSYNSKAPAISNSYGTIESCTRGSILSETLKNERAFIGSAAVTTLNGFDFTNTWADVDYKTPVLKSFANEIDKRIDVDWYTKAEGTADDPWRIC